MEMGAIVSDGWALFSGHVEYLRDHGGIVFVGLRWGSHKSRLVCCKDHLSSAEFRMIKKIRRGDFVSVWAEQDCEDWKVRQVLRVNPRLKHAVSLPDWQLTLVASYAWLLDSIRSFLRERGFIEVRLPTIHFGTHKRPAFLLDFFGYPARLSTSNALYLNVLALNLGKVFTVQPAFRAEPSRTSKHLAEFDLLETACLGATLEDMMDLLEGLVVFLAKDVQQRGFRPSCFSGALTTPFPRVSYQSVASRYGIIGKGLGRYERVIAKDSPIFVTEMAAHLASWSARAKGRGYALSFNFLLPTVGETAEGNEKETNVQLLERKVRQLNLERQLGWYVRHFIHSECSLAGFGLGVERLAMWLFGVDNIRKLRPFFRDCRFPEITPNGRGESVC